MMGSRLAPWPLSVLVLLGGLGVTAGLWRHALQQDADNLSAAFESSADMAANNIRSRFDAYAVVMRGVKGFSDGSKHIAFDEFRDYARALHLNEKSGVQAIGLVMMVTDAEKNRHIAEMRGLGMPDYRIKPEGRRDRYAPITHIEPAAGDNLKALGFDTLTVPAARAAMEQARDLGDIAITSHITLVQDAGKPGSFGFVMYLPIYKKTARLDTPADRRAAITGWVDVPFRMNDLMAGLRGEFDADIGLEIHDGVPLSDRTLMYRTHDTLREASFAAGHLRTSRRLDIGGRQWTLLMSTTPVFEARVSAQHRPAIVVSAGVALTLALSWLAWLLARGQQSAQIRFRQLFDQAGDGVLVLARDHRFVDANPAALTLLGYTRQELLKLGLHDVLAKHELCRLAPAFRKMMAGALHQEEWVHTRKDGTEFPAEVNARRLDGEGYFVILHDLTERKKAEQRIQCLTRLYQALSETNQAIVRMDSNESDLFPLVCRCAVDFGGMKMAWIGQLDEAGVRIVPAAAYGTGLESLDGLTLSSRSDVPEGQGPTGTALRENHPVIINHYLADPMTRRWHARAEQFGWGAAATFPIQRNGKPFAVLTVYHAQADAFDEEATGLLKEMAGDISFALDNFDREARRQLAEKALAENEARMSVILENVSAYIYLKDSAGRYLFANRQVLDLWDETLEEVIGFGDEKFFDAKTVAQIRENDRRVLVDGKILRREETNLVAKTGKTATYWSTKLPLRRADGGIYALCGISTDITERKQAEMALREGEARYRLLFAANPVPMWVYDLETLAFIAVNDAAIAHYGYAREEFFGMTTADIRPPDDVPRLKSAVRQLAANGDDYSESGLWQHRKKDGTLFWAEITGHTLEFEGRHARIILAHDVTARIEAEQQLRLNAQVFESSREGIVITDADNNIISINRAYTKITGFTVEEVIGNNPSLFASEEQDKAFYETMWQSILNHGHWQGEVLNRRKNGELYPHWLSISVIRDQIGRITHHIGILSDLSEHKAAQERIQFLSNFDPLTQLPNRNLLRDRTQLALATAKRAQAGVALIYLDLDRFKIVNDSLGPSAGDQVLKELSGRLAGHLHPDDTLCRQGGDEFILLLPNTDAEGAAHVAGKMLDVITQPFTIDGQRLTLTASIGIAEFPQDGDNFEQLAQSADAALFRAKRNGRNSFQFFTQQMHEQAREVLQIENELRRALEQDELLLYYQPQVDAKTSKIIGVEALIRWQHPRKGMVPPGRFIPIAEESGLIIDIGDWVLRTAIRQAADWQRAGLAIVPVAVNLSVVQFRQGSLYQTVVQALSASKLDPAMLELEMTEGSAMENSERTISVLDQLHELGVALSIDDFGTGYSSLSYLKRFRIDKLKIDQSFVHDLGRDPDDGAIVTAIIGMARSLGFRTIAEGVETREQLDFLRSQQCDEIQGYYFSKPIPAGDFAQLLASGGDLSGKTLTRGLSLNLD